MSDIDFSAGLTEFLNDSNPMLQVLIDALPFPIFYKDKQGVYLGCNKPFEKFIKIPRDQLIGHTVYELYDKIRADIYHNADQALFDNPGQQTYESEIRSIDDDVLFVKFHKTTFYDNAGNVAGLMGAIFDITEQKKLEATLQKLASHDELTGLYNRREGMQRAEELLQLNNRGGTAFSLLMIDVDNFKKINDQYGHATGDLALKHLATQLQNYSRTPDIVTRYGGEEFMILLPETNLDDATVLAERYRKNISEQPLTLDSGKSLPFTISVGVANCENYNLRELFKRADRALYRAKNYGRNRVEVATDR